VKKSLLNADLIFSISNFTKNKLTDAIDLNPDIIKVLPCTVDDKSFIIKEKPSYLLERHSLNVDQPIILTISRLESREKYKSYDVIINALPEILKEIPNLHYFIIGKGDDHQRLSQSIRTLGLEKQITLTGFVPDDEISDYYNLCSLFALPTHQSLYGSVPTTVAAWLIAALGLVATLTAREGGIPGLPSIIDPFEPGGISLPFQDDPGRGGRRRRRKRALTNSDRDDIAFIAATIGKTAAGSFAVQLVTRSR